MKKQKFLKSLLSSLMVITTISASVAPVIAEDTEAEPEILETEIAGDETTEDGAEAGFEIGEEEEEETIVSEAMPAQEFEAADDEEELVVNIEAPEGSLPADTTLKTEKVNAEDYKDKVSELLGRDADVLLAVDISFYGENGEEVEPVEGSDVKVYITSPELAGMENLTIVHIPDEKEPEVIGQLDEAVGENQVAFASDSFSVYAVVKEGEGGDNARAQVNFYNGANKVATYYVKNSDTATEIEQIVADPGLKEVLTGDLVFRGWTTEQNYSPTTTPKTIAQVRTDLAALSITEGTVVNYYAMILKVWKVTYMDPYGIVLQTDVINVVPDAENEKYTVNYPYMAEDDEHNFEGWNASTATQQNIVGYENRAYQNEEEITIKGNVAFTADSPKGNWLVFVANGQGASYTSPIFVKTNQTLDTVKPKDPERYGYTFGGWYTDAACTDGNEFTFGATDTISERTYVYAKWTAAATAKYTILIWKQNVHDSKSAADSAKTYDFAESVTLTGNTGTNINTVTATGTGNGRYASVNGQAKRYTGFHLNKYDQNVEITPEGNAVLNVYYDRNLITLTFQYRSNGRWATQATFTGLYGAKIPESAGAGETYQWPTNRWWYDSYATWGGTYYGSGTRTTFLDAFIISSGADSQTFYGFDGDGDNEVHFLKKNASGSGYTEANVVTSTNGDFYITDKYNGYKAVQYSTNNRNWTNLGNKDSQGRYATVTISNNDLWVRYDPLVYNIMYKDGVYVDGNGNTPEDAPKPAGELHEETEIPFESNINQYANYVPDATSDAYVFEGWYIDDACTIKATTANAFSTMPEGLTVYAKWVLKEYRVFFHPNAGTDESLDWGDETQALNFRVANGKTVNNVTGLRDRYELVGWYFDKAFKQPFNAELYLLNDDITTPYDKTATENYTDNMNKWGNIETSSPTAPGTSGPGYNSDLYAYDKDTGTFTLRDRTWVRRKLDLYARWREKSIGAPGVQVIYDAAGGSNAPEDNNYYVDTANAIVQAASTPADAETEQFLYWSVCKWDATADDNKGAFVPAGKNVYPGDTFEIKIADAKDVELDDWYDDAHTVKKHKYTIQLKAVYGPKTPATPTHIWWYPNFGNNTPVKTNDMTATTDVVEQQEEFGQNEAVIIKPANTFTHEGYKFLGWARIPADGGNLKTLTENDLYLKYDSEADKFYIKDGSGNWTVEVKSVAADERTPYHDMYAVWGTQFGVRYSSRIGEDDEITWYDLGTPVNALDVVATHSGYFYGGYFNNDPDQDEVYRGQDGYWTADMKCDSYTTMAGNALTWTADDQKTLAANEVKIFFVKEVPDYYLSPRLEFYYKKTMPLPVTRLFVVSALDDLQYSDFGFATYKDATETVGSTPVEYNSNCRSVFGARRVSNSTKTVKIGHTITFAATTANQDDVLTADVVTGDYRTESDGEFKGTGYIGYADVNDLVTTEATPKYVNVKFSFAPYYVTYDGITVVGKHLKRIDTGTGYYSGNDGIHLISDTGVTADKLYFHE